VTVVDIAKFTADSGPKVTLVGPVDVLSAGTSTAYSDFSALSSVYVEAQVQLQRAIHGAAALTLLIEHSDDGLSYSTAETFTFGADGTQGATLSSPKAYIRASWTVTNRSEWYLRSVFVAVAASGGGGGGSGSISITDGSTTVSSATTLSISGGTVTNGGGGTADLLVSGGNIYQMFGQPGNLAPGVGVSRMLFPAAATIVGIVLACDTAPGTQSVIVDVNKNGTTIFTTQANRPKILAAAHATAAIATPDVTAYSLGDYLTIDLDQVGVTPAGADLTIGVLYHF
jgi:hypothetical protein